MRTIFIVFCLLINLNAQQQNDLSVVNDYMRSIISDRPYITDVKCATRYQLMIHEYRDQLQPALYQQYLLHMQPDTAYQQTRLTPSGWFQLHWNENGEGAVPMEDASGNGIPDYIDSAMVIFDHVYQVEVFEMGYRPPPAQDGQAMRPYHVYFSDINYYGWTAPSYIDIAAIPGINYSSYIVVDNDYSNFDTPGLDGLRVTAAHEFHHAIQLGYNYRYEDRYFYEMTSTWMEEVLYPDINDYINYVSDLFQNISNTPFNNVYGYYPYANSLYLHMLEKKTGQQTVRQIWDKIADLPSLTALYDVLTQKNISWPESLNEYAMWLYFTGERAIPGEFFTDASYFPLLRIYAADKILFDQSYNNNISVNSIANRYFELTDISAILLNVELNTSGNTRGGFRTVTPTSYSIFRPLNQKILNDPADSDTMILIVTNSDYQMQNFEMSLSVGGIIDKQSIYAFPDPINPDRNDLLRFQNVPMNATLQIYNTSGHLVVRVEKQGNSTIRSWKMLNEQGERIAAGIYLYIVQGDDYLKTGKFAVIR